MQLGIRPEHSSSEQRVAVAPASVAAFDDMGLSVVVQSGSGERSGFSDTDYREAGATVVDRIDEGTISMLASVGPAAASDRALLANNGVVIGMLDPDPNRDLLMAWASDGVTSVSMERIPRTTLAQAMDALSSQATAAGYAAVLLGASALPKFMPMLVTAAGTIPPTKALILGVGVAGLQAIATARRLGAVVSAYDIRPETREQVESLGAKFVEAPTQTMDEGGYARAVDEETAAAQQAVLAKAVAQSDLIITTAQVPGRKAPVLVTAEMVESMASGSVIIDMAAGSGGNVVGSAPDQVVTVDGVAIHGPTDLASQVAADASRMYGRNVLEVAKRMVIDGALSIDLDDAVVGPAIVASPDTGGTQP